MDRLFSLFACAALLSTACSSASGGVVPPLDAASDVGAGEDSAVVGSEGGADAGAEVASEASVDAGFVPAAHQAPPTVASAGGKVLASPKIVTVTFPNDPFAAQIDSLAQQIGATSYFKATTSEYGVGAAQFAKAVHVTTSPGASLKDTDAEAWLIGQLDGTHPEWGTPDGSAVYSLFYPPGTTVIVQGTPSCGQLPGAYHLEVKLASGLSVPYVLIPRCPSFEGLSGIDYVSAAASHEWIEAATDPFPSSAPAYIQEPDKYLSWAIVTGGETGDMCTLTPTVYYKPQGLGFTVQRSWSNMLALAGHDPCAPDPAAPYFNATPVMPDTLSGSYYGQAFHPEGVKIAKGASKAVEVDLWSDQDTGGTWKVRALDLGMLEGIGANLTFAWDKTEGKNGDKLQLTVTRVKDDPNVTGVDAFLVVSSMGGVENAWVGSVGD